MTRSARSYRHQQSPSPGTRTHNVGPAAPAASRPGAARRKAAGRPREHTPVWLQARRNQRAERNVETSAGGGQGCGPARGGSPMSRQSRLSVEQKLRILEECRQPGGNISEVCCRHGICSSVSCDKHSRALRAIETRVREYNERRLHAGLGYIEPAEYFRGDPQRRRAVRLEKLARAREERRRANRQAAHGARPEPCPGSQARPAAGSAPASPDPLRCPFWRNPHPDMPEGCKAEVSLSERGPRSNREEAHGPT